MRIPDFHYIKSKHVSRIIFLLFIFITVFSFPAFSEGKKEDVNNWRFFRDITIGDTSNTYSYFWLDENIYKNAKDDFSDLRIVNEKNEFMPYYIVNGANNETQNTLSYPTTQVFYKNIGKDTVADFELKSLTKNTDILVNKLSLTINRTDYLIHTELYGSYDGLTWETIDTYILYNVNGETKNSIELSKNMKYKFYRFKLLNNLPTLTAISLKAELIQNLIDYKNYIKKTKLKYEISNKNKITEIRIHNEDSLKLSEIDLQIEGTFKRKYSLYTMRENVEDFIQSGSLYSMNFKESNVIHTDIPLSGNATASAKELKIKIENGDDKPLQLKNVEEQFFIDKLVFKSSRDDVFKIYYGNENVTKPIYDIVSYKKDIEKETQTLCTLKEEQTNFSISNSSFNYTMIFNVIIGLVSLFMILLILKKLKTKAD